MRTYTEGVVLKPGIADKVTTGTSGRIRQDRAFKSAAHSLKSSPSAAAELLKTALHPTGPAKAIKDAQDWLKLSKAPMSIADMLDG
ncbi:hypothetical protein, partial [Stenotrophomonas lacuserhaii]